MKAHRQSVILLLFWIVCCDGFGQRWHKRHRHGNEQSPLDAEYEDHGLNAFSQFGPEILVPDPVAMDRLPECQKACNNAFSNAMKVALQAPNHHERFVGVCMHFNESLTCHDELVACPGRDAFDVLTSGLYYACIDQRRAFDGVIDCLDARSGEVQSECENQCRGQSRLSDWASKAGIFNVFSRSENTLVRPFEPENFRLMIHDVCELAGCYLTCIRNAYNGKCGENAGTLLSEAIVRPVAETQSDPLIKSMSTLMYVFVPQQCSFFVREDALATHRIDPAIDRALRKRAEEERRLEIQNSTMTAATGDSSANVAESPVNATQPNQKQPTSQNLNGTAIVGDMSDFDPIDLGEKWGFDIGMEPTV